MVGSIISSQAAVRNPFTQDTGERIADVLVDDASAGPAAPADEAEDLAWLQANTVLSSVSGTIADLKATFPA